MSVLGQRLNNIAGEAVRTWSFSEDTTRVDVRSCLIDPLNRLQTHMSGARAHNFFRPIMQAFFSERKAQTGIILDIVSDRRDEVAKHNQRALLPHMEPESALFTVLHTSHFTMICPWFALSWPTTRANQGLGTTTTDGRLAWPMLETPPSTHAPSKGTRS